MYDINPNMAIILSIAFDLAFYFIFYEDSQYKPFGFHYWLGLVACLWVTFATLISYFIAFTYGPTMVYNRFEQPTVLLFIFFFVLKHLYLVNYRTVCMGCK